MAPPTTITVTAGSAVSAAISNGPANATDWIAYFPVGAADSASLDWRYLNGTTVAPASGLSDATVTFFMPVASGDYEFRLFANDGYARLATSGVVTVVPSPAELTVNGTAPPHSCLHRCGNARHPPGYGRSGQRR